jgi:hypothetical protein
LSNVAGVFDFKQSLRTKEGNPNHPLLPSQYIASPGYHVLSCMCSVLDAKHITVSDSVWRQLLGYCFANFPV